MPRKKTTTKRTKTTTRRRKVPPKNFFSGGSYPSRGRMPRDGPPYIQTVYVDKAAPAPTAAAAASRNRLREIRGTLDDISGVLRSGKNLVDSGKALYDMLPSYPPKTDAGTTMYDEKATVATSTADLWANREQPMGGFQVNPGISRQYERGYAPGDEEHKGSEEDGTLRTSNPVPMKVDPPVDDLPWADPTVHFNLREYQAPPSRADPKPMDVDPNPPGFLSPYSGPFTFRPPPHPRPMMTRDDGTDLPEVQPLKDSGRFTEVLTIPHGRVVRMQVPPLPRMFEYDRQGLKRKWAGLALQQKRQR